MTQGENVTTDILKRELKCKLKDQFKQKWHAEVNNSSKCILYKSYKHDLVLENYVLFSNDHSRRLITKFRLCNHKFAVERGRYSNIERHRRYCDICNEHILGDEYHVLMECKNPVLTNIRKTTIRKCIKNINMFTFTKLMSNISENRLFALNISKFLQVVSQSFKCI